MTAAVLGLTAGAAGAAALLPAPGPGVLASIGSGVGYGCANLLGGLAARRQPVLLTVACSQSVALVLVALAAAFGPGSPHPADIGVGAAAGAAALAGAYLAYQCFRTAQLGICAVLLGLAQLAVPAAAGTVAGIGVHGGAVTPVEILGLGAAALAVAVLLGSRGDRQTHTDATPSGVPVHAAVLALGAGAAFGAYHSTIAISDASSGLWPVVAAEAVIVLVATAGVAARRTRPDDRGGATLASADGAVSAAATLTGLVAVRAADLPTAGALLALLPPATTVVLARVLLHQQQPRRCNLGLALAGLAMVLLART